MQAVHENASIVRTLFDLFSCFRIQAHVHADDDGAKMGFTLWGSMGQIEGAVEASQVVQNNDIRGEVGARYNFAKDFFIGAKINTDKKVSDFGQADCALWSKIGKNTDKIAIQSLTVP